MRAFARSRDTDRECDSSLGPRTGAEPPPVSESLDSCGSHAERLGIVGHSGLQRKLLHDLQRAARFDAEVFLFGETGVGKELYARFVHECSSRRCGPFVAVNCGAIPEALFESEMFGRTAGAFTDSKSKSEGLVAAASGGTLFLDEVHELPRSGQVKLLRLLQEKEYRLLGEVKLRRANIRVVSATNVHPDNSIRDGVLRQDLYYRLNANLMTIMPLRERPEDVELLTDRFVEKYSREYCRPDRLQFTSAARRLLAAYPWPGNIRQLENLVRGLVCQHPDAIEVQADDLPIMQRQDGDRRETSEQSMNLYCLSFQEAKERVVDRFEVDYIREMLRRSQGNICQSAKLAGKNRRAFFELMRKHSIDAEEFKGGSDEAMEPSSAGPNKPR
ncbi:sigma 54-interacting transcriptional regulator [Stieleria varia]|uniref:Transcriptional regulatory protein QseF n=1 Tax=Stieleria varia TaxID=2528005 RepID=A0A5C5ZX83_9BACT|nr:sigma 54-interacting transcriptional regulator [Stieleria varia]TWT91755.1 Transcriptional regulatory protein QseF [Stieleria varia]